MGREDIKSVVLENLSSCCCQSLQQLVLSAEMEKTELCFPQLLNTSCRKSIRPHFEVMLTYILLSSISVVTATLNLLVIISISHFKQLHTPTNLLLFSLAVSDLLVGLVLMPVEIIYIEACWFLGDILCTVYYVMDYIITSASVANMVLISIDRYIAICDPLHYLSKVTKERVQCCVCLSWICSVIFRLLLLQDHLEHPGRSNSCYGECVVVINYIAGVVDLVFTFIIPITVILLLYTQLFAVAVSQARAIRSHIATTQRLGAGVVKKTEMKAARTLGIVVVVFLFCFCPYYYPTLAGKDTAVDASAASAEIWLAHFNSCLNPVIYAFCYPWFRKSIRHILTLQIPEHKEEFYSWKLHTNTNFLILSLAVADFLVSSLQMPVEILLLRGCWMLGDLICAINYFLGFVTISVSVGIMVLISVDRYVAICDPMLYSAKARALRNHVAAVKNQLRTLTANRSELKAARTLGVVVVMFLCCSTPYYALTFAAESSVGVTTAAVQIWLLYLNSCINPLIYTFHYAWFRKSVKIILTLQVLKSDSCKANIL
ncbi:trace amine-associated receptor 13c-like [Xyrichtys novacula]|uniref:Trace amine-associated receptor 13c-like n=1 Tax=Xyrichtys novacula TaxID=13765 RepID=A0AAV1GZD1_XYRNO|nr:trace amine-associated receptor 13c-like [Xyrichtys novacula]